MKGTRSKGEDKKRQLNKETRKRDKVRRNTAIQRQLFEHNQRPKAAHKHQLMFAYQVIYSNLCLL